MTDDRKPAPLPDAALDSASGGTQETRKFTTLSNVMKIRHDTGRPRGSSWVVFEGNDEP